ncbi:MAG: sulfate ABC transporter substrate-binding protein [Acidobacteriota bacterium]
MRTSFLTTGAALAAVLTLTGCGSAPDPKTLTLRNVSYDPTRELYQDINAAFAKHWAEAGKGTISIEQSHGGSGKQARAVIDGLEADVVTLALAYDIDAIASKAKLLPENWQTRLPNNSTPFRSTIVLIVRKGNPKGIKDWDDLVKPGISVITAHPKTSGGARWVYLAAWGYAYKKNNGDEAKAKKFIAELYANVPVLDSGARGATTTFAQRGIGDVLLAWENEAYLAQEEFKDAELEILTPSSSILAEPPVSVVDVVAKKHGTEEAATEYLKFLYTAEAQRIGAKHHYRPTDEAVAKETASQFANINFFTIQEVAGGWQKAQATHFADGGVFDHIYHPGDAKSAK